MPTAAVLESALEGWHLVLNGELADSPRAAALRRLLRRLVAISGLHAICAPAVSVRPPDWSAFVMIAESHIALHGYGRRAFADVFSCRRFDVGLISGTIAAELPGRWVSQLLDRSEIEVAGEGLTTAASTS